MPKLNIDEFDESPKVGDKIRVVGEIKSIDEETGEVNASYDKITIVNKEINDDDTEIETEDEVMPQDQSLDAALARSFPNNQ